ncbi:hypothetical protein Q31b_50360 [Novipirellula aureliae]|uniref:Uncharacterized protein n=2 Tax=Novipirellula aureliae TaxID=2527966 RepID=A0A5C6DJ47_9BACT|nr:hypothetical protein Q31b_50360 [Novipirellula aureliae]
MNPYVPPAENAASSRVRARWLRRFLILNGVLLAIPISIALFIYGSMKIELALQPDTNNGDPITYQQDFMFVSGPVWPIFALFVVPNLILFAMLALSVAGQRIDARD